MEMGASDAVTHTTPSRRDQLHPGLGRSSTRRQRHPLFIQYLGIWRHSLFPPRAPIPFAPSPSQYDRHRWCKWNEQGGPGGGSSLPRIDRGTNGSAPFETSRDGVGVPCCGWRRWPMGQCRVCTGHLWRRRLHRASNRPTLLSLCPLSTLRTVCTKAIRDPANLVSRACTVILYSTAVRTPRPSRISPDGAGLDHVRAASCFTNSRPMAS
jgi:hypothetical protein